VRHISDLMALSLLCSSRLLLELDSRIHGALRLSVGAQALVSLKVMVEGGILI
jgi:hypothetical protein